MAKISDLLRRVNTLLDDTADDDDVIDWFNQCQETITSILYMPKKVTITKTGGVFNLPTDFNTLVAFKEPSIVYNVEIIDNEIYFDNYSEYNTIDIVYNRLPTTITNTPDFEPDLPKQFHQIYVHYACMQAMHPEEEPERYAQYERDYARMKVEIKQYMDKLRPRLGSWAVIR